MKHFFILFIGIFTALPLFSQEKTEDEDLRSNNFGFSVDVFTDIWQETPSDLKQKTINLGNSISGLYRFPIEKTNFSFILGVGISTHKLGSKSYLSVNNQGISEFTPIPGSYLGTDNEEQSISINKNKLSVSYLNVPLEFEFKTKKDLRLAFGLKFGTLLQTHTKYKGTSYTPKFTTNGGEIKVKEYYIDNIAKTRYGITARFGYKFINLYGFYSISKLFEEGKGPEVFPVSIGISIVPF